tara:strand:- start:2006 stop:3253 length:1248 start_codon:yes stop_codon:yes gene_type:complete
LSGGQQAENTLHENAIGWAMLLVAVAAIGWLFWYYYDTEIRNIVRWIRYAEMWVISWFIYAQNAIFDILGMETERARFVFNGKEYDWEASFVSVDAFKKEQLTYTHLSMFGAMAMQPLKHLFIFICGLGCIWCIFKGPRTYYRQRMGLENLIYRQAFNFPVISPFVKFNPATQPPRPPGSPVPAELPLFAEALGPEEWIAYNSIPIPDGNLDREAAAREFKKQLIGRWKGPMALEPYMQVLLAAFCLKSARKRDEADDMLGRLATCWEFKTGLNLKNDKTLLNEARKIIKNKDISGELLAKCNRHAFITTAMLRALMTAREEGGVLAPATFVWLRAHNRTLWYPLNNLGRQSYHLEAIGAMSHFKAERLTQRPIPVPKVEDAVDTISEYMQSIKARPIPQLDYSNSKKKGVKKAI